MDNMPDIKNCKVAIIGMGYVGLPLALEINKVKFCFKKNEKLSRKVIGFDINKKRINELNGFFDRTNEIPEADLKKNKDILYTDFVEDIWDADFYLVTVPTPIDDDKKPNLSAIKGASKTIGGIIKKRKDSNIKKNIPVIVFESTVYPGLTEEICIPIIEAESNGKANEHFLCGYSPERVNPGDKKRSLGDIVKITSGLTEETADIVDNFYSSFIKAGTYKAQTIQTAEMAKIIENTQRDINVALVNELAIICKKLNLDTIDVLDAAATKWNFINFRPGLVGGHCIGVDPYYLTYKSKLIGYNPEVVLSGRKINDSIDDWIINQIINFFDEKNKKIINASFLILGVTFKEDCPDIRNSGAIKVVKKMKKFINSITIVDPNADKEEVLNSVGLELNNKIPQEKKYDFVLLLVGHKVFRKLLIEEWKDLISNDGKYFDLKGIIPRILNPIRI